MRTAWTAALALVAGLALTTPADQPEPGGSAVKDRKGFIPQRKFVALKGKAVGVLVSDVRPVMSHDGRGGPADAMGFSSGNGSYRWVYVPAQNKNPLITNLNVEVGEKANDKRKAYPALNMANANEVKRWDINVPYSLVEAEVNDGLGSPPTEGFVATKMTRLDGTEKYPLKMPDVIADAKKRYQSHLKARQSKIDSEMAAVQKKVLKGRKVTGPKSTDELLYLTWLPESQRVRVALRTRVSDGAFTETTIRRGGGRPLPLPPRPAKQNAGQEKARLFRPPPPRDIKVRYGVAFGVELGAAYEYDVKGKLVATHELTPESFSHETPPPPGVQVPKN